MLSFHGDDVFVFGTMSAKTLQPDARNRNFTSAFGDRTISCERVAPGPVKSQFYFIFLVIELHFVQKGLPDLLQIAILLQFLAIEPFRAKGFAGPFANRNFTSVFGDRTLFRAKGFAGPFANRNFTSVFGNRTSFRAKGLRFVPSRWHCPAPSREK